MVVLEQLVQKSSVVVGSRFLPQRRLDRVQGSEEIPGKVSPLPLLLELAFLADLVELVLNVPLLPATRYSLQAQSHTHHQALPKSSLDQKYQRPRAWNPQ